MNSQSSTCRNTPKLIIIQVGDEWHITTPGSSITEAWFHTEAEAIECLPRIQSRQQTARLANLDY